jgi:hypothetical protein
MHDKETVIEQVIAAIEGAPEGEVIVRWQTLHDGSCRVMFTQVYDLLPEGDDKLPARGRSDAEVMADLVHLAEQHQSRTGTRLSLTALRKQMAIGDARGRALLAQYYRGEEGE